MQEISADDKQDAASGFRPLGGVCGMSEESKIAEVIANRRCRGRNI